MSRFDYADPGTDPVYCDGLAPDDETEVCPDCLGSGEVNREDGSDQIVTAVCLECNGKGWIA